MTGPRAGEPGSDIVTYRLPAGPDRGLTLTSPR
jgi:hypothetical protein